MGLFFVLILLYFIFYLLINAWLTGMEAGIIISKQIGNEHQHFSTPTQGELPFLKIKAIPWHLLPHPVQLFFFFCQEKHQLKWSSVDVFCFLQDILNWWLEIGWRYYCHIFTCQNLAKHHQAALAVMLWWPYITGENCPPSHFSQ